jgi:AcrR family transcriptional regulator
MADDQELRLRPRAGLGTRLALSDAALELAFERGLENVRREDIAARAGVSTRTFANYFASKYEAIGYRQVERIQRGVALLDSCPADQPIWAAITSTLLEPLAVDGAGTPPTPDQLIEIRKLLDTPEWQGSMMRRVFGPDGDLAAAVARRTGTDPGHDLYPRLVAGAVGVAVQVAFDAYAHADPPQPVTELLRRTLADIAAGLPDPSRA